MHFLQPAGLPVDGKVIAGFAAFKQHLSYLPHSGSVFPELADELAATPSRPGPCIFLLIDHCRRHWWRSWSEYGCGKRSLPTARCLSRAANTQVPLRSSRCAAKRAPVEYGGCKQAGSVT
jgi:hypothetical protein